MQGKITKDWGYKMDGHRNRIPPSLRLSKDYNFSKRRLYRGKKNLSTYLVKVKKFGFFPKTLDESK